VKQVLISAGIVFHLTVILLYPNGSSDLRRDLFPLILPYANTFGLNSAWQFFAPDPESATYIEYEIDWKALPPNLTGEEVYKWPPDKRGLVDVFYTRRNTSRAFLSFDEKFVTGIFINWICRKNPEAAGVSARKALIRVPSLAQVQNGQPIFDASSVLFSDPVTASCDEVRRVE
jgi:hypothetical protein